MWVREANLMMRMNRACFKDSVPIVGMSFSELQAKKRGKFYK